MNNKNIVPNIVGVMQHRLSVLVPLMDGGALDSVEEFHQKWYIQENLFMPYPRKIRTL